DRGALEAELRARLGRLDPDDLEGRMDELRRFKQANLLRVAAAALLVLAALALAACPGARTRADILGRAEGLATTTELTR
ncbi:hypothetical protein G3N55_13035, partial [Dissulfurirhabdus thermomarina]